MSVIMDRARGNGKNGGIDVAMMFLLPGLLLSILSLAVTSDALDVVEAPPARVPTAGQDVSPPGAGSVPFSLPDPPPSPDKSEAAPPPLESLLPPPPLKAVLPPLVSRIPPPPNAYDPSPPPPPLESPPPADVISPSSPPADPGDTWNESEKAGVVIASIAALLQVAVVAFLLIKRHQMLTTVEYDDIDDLEYDHPRDPIARQPA